MTTLHGSWIWYELFTGDPAGAKAFYEAVVGWRITLGTEPPVFYGHIANADGGSTGGLLPLTEEMKAHGARPAWLGYIGVDDVDAAVIDIEAHGGKVLMPKMAIEVGSFALVADCCGAPFYVMTPVPVAGMGPSTAFSRDLPGRCTWNELCASDQQAAIAFYTALFGWGLPEPMDMGAMGTYQFIEHDGVGLGAIMKNPPQSPPKTAISHWNHYFRVGNIDETVVRVKEAGGQVVNGPMQVPGGDWVLQGLDPEGTFFGLVGSR